MPMRMRRRTRSGASWPRPGTHAEQQVYQLEKLIEESKDKLSESDRAAVTAAIEKVNQVKDQDDAAAINRALDELQRASQAMAEHLYSSGKPGPGAGEGPPPGAGGPPPGADGPGAEARGRDRRRIRREEITPISRAFHGISIRAAHAQEPGGCGEGTDPGSGAGASAARGDAPAGRAPHPEQQVVRSLLSQLGVNPDQILQSRRGGAERLSQDLRRRALDQPGAFAGLRCRAGRSRADEGPVRIGRAPAAGARQGQDAGPGAAGCARHRRKGGTCRPLQKVRGGQRVTDQTPEDKYQALERYGRDLVGLAKNGKMDPVIGRDAEDPAGGAGAFAGGRRTIRA